MNEPDRAIELLQQNYEKAQNEAYVIDPIAWALYQTWTVFSGMGAI